MDVRSEVDQDEFVAGASAQASRGGASAGRGRGVPSAFTRAGETSVGWGRGPVPVDKRKFRYDVSAALTRKAVGFSATKVDRMDAVEAGDVLHRIHTTFGIQNEPEERIHAFDQALWYEHAVNGGSTLQAERGALHVAGMDFDIPVIVKILGVDARRFFRAYADEVINCLRGVVHRYTPYDPEAAEMYAAVMQVAVARGLQKYPHLIHDSSDAAIGLSIEERVALQASKRMVIQSTVNAADSVSGRVGQAAGFGSSAAVAFDKE